MALLDIVKKNSTSRSVTIRIIDATAGTPETGVVFNTAGIDLWYRREDALVVSITEADLTTPDLEDTWETGGFLHISDGEYRLDVPDAAYATGVNHFDVGGTVTGMVVIGGRVKLVDVDLEDTVRAGLTALPNAAADAAGGLPISDAGGLDLDTKLANTNEVTVARMGVLTDWIDAGRLDAILDIIAADVVNIDGDAMRGTDGANTTVPDAAGIAATPAEVATALTNYDAPTKAEMDTAHALLATPAQVNTQVSDVVKTDAIAELAADPGATPTLEKAIMLVYMALRNKLDVTAATKEIHNNAGDLILQKALSDDGDIYSEGKMAAP